MTLRVSPPNMGTLAGAIAVFGPIRLNEKEVGVWAWAFTKDEGAIAANWRSANSTSPPTTAEKTCLDILSSLIAASGISPYKPIGTM